VVIGEETSSESVDQNCPLLASLGSGGFAAPQCGKAVPYRSMLLEIRAMPPRQKRRPSLK